MEVTWTETEKGREIEIEIQHIPGAEDTGDSCYLERQTIALWFDFCIRTQHFAIISLNQPRMGAYHRVLAQCANGLASCGSQYGVILKKSLVHCISPAGVPITGVEVVESQNVAVLGTASDRTLASRIRIGHW